MQCADVYWGVQPVGLVAFCHIVLSASWFLPSPVMWFPVWLRLLSQASAPKNFCLTFNLNYEKLIRGNLV